MRRLTAAQWAVAAFVLGLTAVGLYLRLRFLGELGLDRYQDEDIMAVAVQGIREHGYPLMPTGMIYIRALPLLYMMAASTALFDFNEFALRLPPALFGTALIPLSYLLARRFLPVYGALLVVVLVCFSAWQIDVSRTARMYAPFSFFYVLAIYFFIVFKKLFRRSFIISRVSKPSSSSKQLTSRYFAYCLLDIFCNIRESRKESRATYF